jgi:predicted MPP superfamily phosphohydrolase
MITRRGVLKGLLGLGASLTAFGAYAVGVEPLLRLEIARYRLTPPGWPPDLQLRIVALADIHANEPWMPPARVAGIVERANQLDADIVLLLGDYVGGRRFGFRNGRDVDWAGPLRGLRAPLGVHAILGNHDWWHDGEAMRTMQGPTFVHRGLEAIGANVLDNDAVRLEHRGRPFWLAGLGDQMAFNVAPRRRTRPWNREMVGWGVDDLPGTLAKLTDDAPAILLAHEPDVISRVPPRIALTLSGHTHGGQVNLFGWRPASGSPGSSLYPRGAYAVDGRDLIVSSGLGCSVLPVRVGVPPEIMVVELGGT